MRESVGAIECPRYASVRDWSSADSGNRGLIWHAGTTGVTLVNIVTDTDRRVVHFDSETAALEAIHAGAVTWAKPPPRSKATRTRTRTLGAAAPHRAIA